MPVTIQQIEGYHQAEPFKPFVLVLDDERRIVIERPEFLGWFSSRDRIFYSTPEDTTETLEIRRIARIEPDPKRGTGPRRRAG